MPAFVCLHFILDSLSVVYTIKIRVVMLSFQLTESERTLHFWKAFSVLVKIFVSSKNKYSHHIQELVRCNQTHFPFQIKIQVKVKRFLQNLKKDFALISLLSQLMLTLDTALSGGLPGSMNRELEQGKKDKPLA